MLFDLISKLKIALALTPVARTATVSDAPIIDLKGYESVMFAVVAGAITAADGSNYYTASLLAGDASDLSDGVAVSGADLLGTAPVVNATSQADSYIGKLGYRGTKRYIRIVFTETGTFNGVVGAVAILGNARTEPQS